MTDKTAAPAPAGTTGTAFWAGVALLAAIVVAVSAWLAATAGDRALGPIDRYALAHQAGSSEFGLFDTVAAEPAGKLRLPMPFGGFAISKPLGLVIASDEAAGVLRIYDFETQTERAVVELPFVPGHMLVSPDGLQLALADPVQGQLALVSLADGHLSALLDGFDTPANFAYSSDSAYLFFPDNRAGRIEVVMVDGGHRMDAIPLTIAQGQPSRDLSALTRTPNGLYGLVADQISGEISVINFRNWAEQATLRVGARPTRPYITADGQYVIVASQEDLTISIISTQTLDIVAVLPGLSDVTSVATGYFETHAFVVSATERKALVVDLTTMAIKREIALEGTPGIAAADSEGKRVFVTHSGPDGIAVIDAYDLGILSDSGPLGVSPQTVIFAETNNYCH